MTPRRTALALCAVFAVVVAGGQGISASAASPVASPAVVSPSPGQPSTARRAQRIASAQAGADVAGRALRLGGGERLVVKDVITDGDGSTHVRYDRTFDGLRVIGGDLVSHRDRSGKVRDVSWNGVHRVSVASTTPKVSLASARGAGSRRAGLVQRSTATSKGELVVYAGGGSARATPKLAYDVLTVGLRTDQTPSRVHTIVDARTGATLTSWDEIETGTGHGLHVGTVPIGTTATAGPAWAMRDAVGNQTTDLNGAGNGTGNDIGSVPGALFTDADNSWGNGAITDRASAGVDAHYGAEKTFDYYKNVLGRNGIRGNGAGARSRVHYGNGYVNAFWDGTQMTYGDGASNTHPLVELDVAGHEMTHGVTENTAALVGDGEAGGLNEATSDIFGTSVEWYVNNAVDNPDYLIGELINIKGDGKPLRYMDRPSRDSASPDCWSTTVSTLDSHLAAGPLNHWFYLASEGSGAKVVNGVSYNSPTCNSSAVIPIGRDKAARIWYRTLTTYLTSSSTYAAAREGAIQSAKDLYGATSAECTGIAASFSAIGVAPGSATCATTSPQPSGSNLLKNPGFESGNALWSATPNVIGQWGLTQPAQPARSGTWSAWLGGYGVVHDDSVSQLVTIPAGSSASLSYYMHIDTAEAPGSPAYDTMTVRAGSTALQTLSNVNAAAGYVRRTVSLSAYAGRTISLSFSGSEDGAAATSFVLDDASVTSLTAPGAPTGVSGTAGSAQTVVAWAAPVSNGGTAITGYTIRVVNAATGVQVGALRLAVAGARTLTVTGLANGTAYRFQVLARNLVGAGPYSSLTGPVTPAATAAVTRLSDFTRDGFTDLVARDSAGTLWLYPGTGAGGFQARRSMGAGWNSLNALVTAGDVSGDGNADVIARDSLGRLWLYPGNGAGALSTRRQIGSGWASLTITDAGNFNGVGRPDLLARDSAGVLWLYPLSGNAVFGPRVSVSSGLNGYTILGPGDVSGDGRADILARDTAGALWLYRGNGSGAVTARTAASSGLQAMTALVTPGNWNRTGGNDLLARDSAGRLWLYPGNNVGSFNPPTVIGTGWTGMTYLG